MITENRLFAPFRLLVLIAAICFCSTGPAVAQQRLPRILLGQETDDYPSVGIVGSVSNGGFCSGTLISSTHVLTAAHCAEVIESPTRGTFQLGDQLYRTADVIVHPDYNPFSLANDLAILQLDEPVLDVEPALIFRDRPLVGDLLFIVGFGATGTADGGSDGTFGVKRVGVTTVDEVTATLVNWVFDDENETNTASGDSGGPGFLELDEGTFVASVTSGGTEPDSVLGDIAFNTRVDAFADWIDLTVALSEQPNDEDPPGVVDPGSPDEVPDEGDVPDEDDDFFAQPFPFLQLLIDLLTQLLEFLNDAVLGTGGSGDDGPADSPSQPADTPQDPQAEDPTDCPIDNPVVDPIQPVPGDPPAGPVEAPAIEDEAPSGTPSASIGTNRLRRTPARNRIGPTRARINPARTLRSRSRR